jgi:hypothetical protein
MKNTILSILLLCVLSCNNATNKVYIYDLYNKDLKKVQENIFTINYHPIHDTTYSVILNGNFLKEQYVPYKNQEIYFAQFKKEGIYLSCKDSFVLTYSFMPGIDSENRRKQKKCDWDLPFRHSHIAFAKQKLYNDTCNIICYSEMSAEDNGQATYYLKNFGFLCYDYSWNGDFLLCRKSFNTGLPDEVLQAIGDSLIQDTMFFTRHIIARN